MRLFMFLVLVAAIVRTQGSSDEPVPGRSVREDLHVIIGGHFSADHIGPEELAAISDHVTREPTAFAQHLRDELRSIPASEERGYYSSRYLSALIALLGSASPLEARSIQASVRETYDRLLADRDVRDDPPLWQHRRAVITCLVADTDLRLFRQKRDVDTAERGTVSVSTDEAVKAAQRVLAGVLYRGMEQRLVVDILGDPARVSDLNRPLTEQPAAELTYRFDSGNNGVAYAVTFDGDRVVGFGYRVLYEYPDGISREVERAEATLRRLVQRVADGDQVSTVMGTGNELRKLADTIDDLDSRSKLARLATAEYGALRDQLYTVSVGQRRLELEWARRERASTHRSEQLAHRISVVTWHLRATFESRAKALAARVRALPKDQDSQALRGELKVALGNLFDLEESDRAMPRHAEKDRLVEQRMADLLARD